MTRREFRIRDAFFLLALVLVACSFAANLVKADPFTTIYRFDSTKDGRVFGSLTADMAGNFYGAASPSTYSSTDYCGGVFRLNKPTPSATAWTYTDLYKLGQTQGSPDGECRPVLTPPVLRNHFLYGSTLFGPQPGLYYGSVFRFDLSRRTFSVLHGFDGTDGDQPNGLVGGPDGMLYGTTFYGGPNVKCDGDPRGSSEGILFKLRSDGNYRVLHAFGHGNSSPNNELVFGPDGAMYGTTARRCADGKFAAGTV